MQQKKKILKIQIILKEGIQMKGIVKYFDNKKGYGFIISGEENKDIFFHYSEIQTNGYKTVCEGQWVEFTLDETLKGKIAKGIVKL